MEGEVVCGRGRSEEGGEGTHVVEDGLGHARGVQQRGHAAPHGPHHNTSHVTNLPIQYFLMKRQHTDAFRNNMIFDAHFVYIHFNYHKLQIYKYEYI